MLRLLTFLGTFTAGAVLALAAASSDRAADAQAALERLARIEAVLTASLADLTEVRGQLEALLPAPAPAPSEPPATTDPDRPRPPSTEPPPTRPPDDPARPRPPPSEPPPDPGDPGRDPPLEDWAAAPRVEVRLTLRDGATGTAQLGAPMEWTLEDGWRWQETRVPFGGMALLVWREQWAGIDATRVTAALVNGAPDRGVAYFAELEVSLEGSRVLHLEGQHCVIPRGMLVHRWHHGPQAEQLASWEMVRDHLPSYGVESWAGAMAAQASAWADQHKKLLGPYNIGLPGVQGNTSFNGSHGGWLISPFGGGSQSWHAGALESWRLAEKSMLGTMARSPIAILDAQTLQPYNPKEPYWLGRTVQHELPGFREQPDDWCPYGQELYWYRPHNYSHMWRQIRDAAQLAPFDAAARWFLLTSWHDCLLWLDNGVGAEQYLHTHRGYDWMVQSPPGVGANWAGRGFAHVVRCFLETEPYLPTDHAAEWREKLIRLIQVAVVPGTGVAHGAWGPDPLDSHLPQAERMQPPIARAREVELLGSSFLPLGLEQEDADWRRFMAAVDGESVSAAFEIRPGMSSWKDGKTAIPAYFPGYDAQRGDLSPYGGTVESLLQSASTYYGGIGENPLDWTDPAAWR